MPSLAPHDHSVPLERILRRARQLLEELHVAAQRPGQLAADADAVRLLARRDDHREAAHVRLVWALDVHSFRGRPWWVGRRAKNIQVPADDRSKYAPHSASSSVKPAAHCWSCCSSSPPTLRRVPYTCVPIAVLRTPTGVSRHGVRSSLGRARSHTVSRAYHRQVSVLASVHAETSAPPLLPLSAA